MFGVGALVPDQVVTVDDELAAKLAARGDFAAVKPEPKTKPEKK